MKLGWVDAALILFGLFLAYQLLLKIIGGSWQMESLIVAFLVFNFGLLWRINSNLWQLNSKFEGHLGWYRGKNG